MELPTDYDGIFKNNMIIVTGVARSGTTIIGKIAGSLSNAHYLFEPSTTFLFPTLVKNGHINEKEGGELLKAILFEDFYLQMIQGRYLNFNEGEHSFVGNYVDPEMVKKRNIKLKRKMDVLEYLKNENCTYVYKNPNLQLNLETVKKIFPGVKFIHVIRNGKDVISSSIRRDFYSEKFLNERNVEWVNKVGDIKIPWFVEKEERSRFAKWNHHTRAAYIWRFLTEEGMNFTKKNKDVVLEFKYEEFIEYPDAYVKKIEKFIAKKRTGVTNMHIKSTKSYKYRDYPDVIEKISSPEKERYIKLNEKLGYL